MTQQTELGRLIGVWDGLDPASPQSTALLNVLQAAKRHLEMLDEQMAAVVHRLEAQSTAGPRTTGDRETPTTTTASPSDAEGLGSTPPPTQASSLSDLTGIPSGPVGLDFASVEPCPHWYENLDVTNRWQHEISWDGRYTTVDTVEVTCRLCNASWLYAKTPALDARPTSLTSASPATPSSAGSPPVAASPSSESADGRVATSEAGECEHEPDWDLWGQRNRWRGAIEFSTEGELPHLTVACRKCNETLSFSLAPEGSVDGNHESAVATDKGPGDAPEQHCECENGEPCNHNCACGSREMSGFCKRENCPNMAAMARHSHGSDWTPLSLANTEEEKG